MYIILIGSNFPQFDLHNFEAQILYFCSDKEKATPPPPHGYKITSCMQKSEPKLQAILGFTKPR